VTHTRTSKWLYLSVLGFCIVLPLHAQQTLRSENPSVTTVPRLVRVSNTFHPANGLPAAPVESVTLSVYSEETGGTPLWQETQNVNIDADGRYTVLMGSTQNDGVPLDLFSSSEPRWLGVQFNRAGETEQPRVRLASVPYALKASDAETLGGLPASAYLRAPSGSAGSGSTAIAGSTTFAAAAPPSVVQLKPQIASGASANSIPMFTDNAGDLGNSVISQVNGNLGMGTATPGALVDIEGIIPSAAMIIGRYTGLASQGPTSLPMAVRTARGTPSSPSAVQQGDLLGPYVAQAWDGTGFGQAGQIIYAADQNWTSTQHGTHLSITTVADGTTSPAVRMYIDNAGNVGIGTSTPAHTLDVAGSVNSQGNLTVAGNLSVTGAVNLSSVQSTFSATNGAAVSGQNTSTSTTGYPVGVQGSVTGTVGAGVNGNASQAGAVGVNGFNSATTGNATGVYGGTNSPGGSGVVGTNNSTAGGVGVSGNAAGPHGVGVNGSNSYVGTAGDGSSPVGVQGGVIGPTGAGVAGNALMAGASGVSGYNSATSGYAVGVAGTSASANGMGVNGFNSYVGRAGDGSFPVGVQGSVNGPTGAGVSGSALMAGASGVSGNNSATSGYAVGVQGNANSPNGGAGVQGGTTSATAVGVRGNNNATTGYAVGVGGFTQSNQGAGVQGSAGNGAYGVVGNAFGTMGWEVGTQGVSSSPEGVGVQGETFTCTTNPCSFIAGTAGQFQAANTGLLLQGMSGAPGAALNTATEVFHVDGNGGGFFADGVQGETAGVVNETGGGHPGIAGLSTATSGFGVGTAGISASPGGAGIGGLSGTCGSSECTLLNGTGGAFYASSDGGGFLLRGFSGPQGSDFITGTTQVFSVDGHGTGTFAGDLNVGGTLTASVKNFKIDDPLDPEHKSLYHASIESSEMVNVYSGNVFLNRNGEAIVTLPDWFEALNTDFRYQLTTIGGSARVYVAREIQNHQFKIAGGRPGMKVSWQVTGVRHDAWAQSHPMQVEQAKPIEEAVRR